LAILQVNVRPADWSRQTHHRPQRGGQAGDFKTRIQQFRPRFHRVNSITTPDADYLHPSNNRYSDAQSATQSATQSAQWQTVMWTLIPGATVGAAQLSATQRLRDAGSVTASLDAQVLLAHLLGKERSWLFAHHDHKLDATETEAYADLVARRTAGEPIAYLIGKREFYDLTFAVDPRVLIPRPETEFLVDAALAFIAARAEAGKETIVADIGTGSGAIALTLAKHAPQTSVYATDISNDALAVAGLNADRLDLRARVTFCQGDLLAPLPKPVHLIAANLPYVKHADYVGLDVDVHDYEPQQALDAGEDGLEVIRRLLAAAPSYLLPGGMILLEIGYDQAEATIELAHVLLPDLKEIDIEQDYAGLDRLVRIQH
jgi:release factor glutamine methyltransferase